MIGGMDLDDFIRRGVTRYENARRSLLVQIELALEPSYYSMGRSPYRTGSRTQSPR